MKNIIETLVVGKYYQIENHIAICEMLNSTSNKKCLSRISGVGSVLAFYDEVKNSDAAAAASCRPSSRET